MMCNEKHTKQNKEYDYRFIDYRLTQLEQNLRKGQEKLETEQTQNYKEILQILQTLQENNQNQNKTLTELNTRIKQLEQKYDKIDTIKEKTTEHTKEISHLNGRLDIYKQITIIIGGATATALITAFTSLLFK